MEHFKFSDINKLASTIIIGGKTDDKGEAKKAAAMHELIKMVHPASVHLHVDPVPEEGPPPDEKSFSAMKTMFDFVFIYPECERVVFEKTLEHIAVDDHIAKIDEFHATSPNLPMVICLNRMNPGSKVEIKAMKA